MKPLIIANWKCNPTSQQDAKHLFFSLSNKIKQFSKVEVVICPPFVYLPLFKEGIILGSQDCHWQNKGAYTGQVSPRMLKDLNCQYVILGHSERRRYFKETDQLINRKIKTALRARLKPILCLGEEVRDSFDSQGRPLNEMSLVIAEQLEKDLSGLTVSRLRDLVVAYEPVWAIGSGQACPPEEAMKAALFIRQTLTKLYSRSAAEKVRVVYGGSVNSKNGLAYIKETVMDGLLVGGASLNATEFIKLVEKVNADS